jgi:hypothetical protein
MMAILDKHCAVENGKLVRGGPKEDFPVVN